MRFDEVVNLVVGAWKEGDMDTSYVLLGKPGTGKTECGKDVAAAMTAHVQARSTLAAPALCEVVDLSSRLPEDVGGLPFRTKIGELEATQYAPQVWLSRLCQDGVYGVLILDDIPAAAPAVQVASRQLVLNRQVGESRLAKDVVVMGTGNRREDKSGATTLPAHFRNSVCLLDLETDVESWCNWYGKQPKHASVIASFVRYKPTMHAMEPKDADQRGAFATPRSWARLGRLYQVASDQKVLLDVASGLVGEGPATEFCAFVNVRAQLVSPDDVLRNPRQALPHPKATLSSADRAYAMVTGLAETAAQWRQGHRDPRVKALAPLMFLRALGWATPDAREYVSTALACYVSNGGLAPDLILAARENATDPDVKAVIDFLQNAWNKKA